MKHEPVPVGSIFIVYFIWKIPIPSSFLGLPRLTNPWELLSCSFLKPSWVCYPLPCLPFGAACSISYLSPPNPLPLSGPPILCDPVTSQLPPKSSAASLCPPGLLSMFLSSFFGAYRC